MVEGTTLGGITDIDGNFILSNLPSSAKTLVVSYVGMVTQKVAIKQGMLKIVLQSDTKILDEVVVTAMGIKRSEKSIGTSTTAVKGDKLAENRSGNVMSGLAGQVAGVQISATSSDPGASNNVVVRGISSLSGNNQPLYIVDGVPINNSVTTPADQLNGSYDFGNGANAVNPDDVESMTILKGAAATALYGSRAANGVILITTKSGTKQQKGLGVEYNGGVQWSSLLRIPQMQNEFGMGWYGDKTSLENGSWGPKFDGSMQLWGNAYNNSQRMKPYSALKDNVKDFFDTGLNYSNSVSFNGATDKSNYFVSFSQLSDNGMLPGDADTYDKYTFSARGSHTIKNLTFSSALNYVYQKNNFATTGQGLSMYNSVLQTPRDVSLIGMKDLDNPFNNPGYYYTPYGVTNPYYILDNYLNSSESERFYGKFQMDYSFLKFFKLTYRFGLDTTTQQIENGAPNLSALYQDTPNWELALQGETGHYLQQTVRRRELNHDLMLSFDMPINNDWQVDALVGFNGNERRASSLASEITNLTIPTWYNLQNSAGIPSTSTSLSIRRLMGVYVNAEAAWRNMVYVTVTARNDWSSTLPKGNRSFFYPGVTGSFLFSELLSDRAKKVISFGKVRIAWGKTGNDAAPYMTDVVYSQGSSSSTGYGNGSNFPFNKNGSNAYSVGNVLGSKTLSPEMTTELEFGANMAFFNNRISFDATYYNRNSDKQIFSLNMDPASGYNYQNMNLGKVNNHGLELLVNVTPIKTKDFKWDITWNWTKNWSKVVDLPDELGGSSNIIGLEGAASLCAVEGQEMGVFKATVPVTDGHGHIVVNPATGLPVEGEEKIVGSMNYKYQTGLSTTLTYKGISVSADLDIREGGLMYSNSKHLSYFTGNAIQTAYNDRNPFIIPNSVIKVTDPVTEEVSYIENTTALDATQIYNYWNNGGSDLGAGSLVDKSFIKLRSLVVSWDLPSKWLAKTPLSKVRLSLFGNNLFMWTPSGNTFMDPESTSFGNDLDGNFGEWIANPSSRRMGFNVTVKF
jgi:TonB-linked SusC/RagA family outer membrane protein